jgi:hypothetical protein
MSSDGPRTPDFGKRGRAATDQAEASAKPTAMQRLKQAGSRWWAAVGTPKAAPRSKGFKRARPRP